MPFPKPCLDCGQLTTGARYCLRHATARASAEQERLRRRPRKTLYQSAEYKKTAKLFRDTATICHLCGLGPIPNDPFTADHIIPGDPLSPLAPAHKSCNSSRGNRPLRS